MASCTAENWCPYSATKAFLFSNQKLNWPAANTYCLRQGGYLASIESPEENSFLTDSFLNIFNGSYDTYYIWVGLYETPRHSLKYKWADGSPYNYTNWVTGEPNDHNRGENVGCLFLYHNGLWNDYPDNRQVGFVCSKKGIFTQAPTHAPTNAPTSLPGVVGDPHIMGFNGHDIIFEGSNKGWYTLLSDERIHLNIQTGDLQGESKKLRYVTGMGVVMSPSLGSHTVVVEVTNDSREDDDVTYLAGGLISYSINNHVYKITGFHEIGEGVSVAAFNSIYECLQTNLKEKKNQKTCDVFLSGNDMFSYESNSYAEVVIGTPYFKVIDQVSKTYESFRMDIFLKEYTPRNPSGILGKTLGEDTDFQENDFIVTSALDTKAAFI